MRKSSPSCSRVIAPSGESVDAIWASGTAGTATTPGARISPGTLRSTPASKFVACTRIPSSPAIIRREASAGRVAPRRSANRAAVCTADIKILCSSEICICGSIISVVDMGKRFSGSYPKDIFLVTDHRARAYRVYNAHTNNERILWISLDSSVSTNTSRFTFSQEWITVVWSRPPSFTPIVG